MNNGFVFMNVTFSTTLTTILLANVISEGIF